MRKFTLLLSLLTLLFSSVSFAQDVLVVEPGIGTLNAAITANGGNKIYQLKAGAWYQLDAVIEHTDFHLQIIGEKPSSADQLPPTLQTNDNAEGAVFSRMFTAFGDITIKGVYIMNVDLLGAKGGNFLFQNDSLGRTVIDNCIIEPIAGGSSIILNGASTRTYFTNNQVFNMGHQLGADDGHFFVVGTDSGFGLDTLYVENNTFVCMGTNMFAAGFNKIVNNYIKFNHNTWVMQKSQFDWSVWEETFIFSNNLMFDCQTQPWVVTWQPMPGADKSHPLPCLIYADTIPDETLPSTRQQFWEYNNHYRNPKFYTLLEHLNVKGTEFEKPEVYYMPIIWNSDDGESREAQLFGSADFPNWKAGNNTENIDPKFEDPKIYEHSDKFVDWTKYASYAHPLSLPTSEYPPNTEWEQYHWDADGDVTVNSAWPVFNGKYTNPDLLKASIEGLPLGDLNWFPESKSKWEAKKEMIDAHIHAGNEDKLTLVSVNELKKKAFSMYPNPAQNVLNIDGVIGAEVSILSVDGRVLINKTISNSIDISSLDNGCYIVSVKNGNQTSSQKLIIKK